MTEEKKPTTKKPKKYLWLRRIGWFFLGLLLFIILVLLFIRSPWGQNIIVTRAVNYISDKTNTKVEIDKFFITFDGDLLLEGLYLEDKKGDTLIYSRSLEGDIPLWSIIQGNGIGVEALDSDGLRANIIRNDTISGFNFQFLADAFASESPDPTQVDSTASAPPEYYHRRHQYHRCSCGL